MSTLYNQIQASTPGKWESKACFIQGSILKTVKVGPENITRNRRKVGCPVICMDTIHYAILFTETATIPGRNLFIQAIAISVIKFEWQGLENNWVFL